MFRRFRTIASDFRFRRKFVEGTYAHVLPFRAGGSGLRTTVEQRREIWARHGEIHERFVREGLEIVHTKLELALVCEAILSCDIEGPVVEFGCYHGLSTAKMSLVAKAAGRRLVVFDSFEGLPEPRQGERDERDSHADAFQWKRGQYADRLEAVRTRVERDGCVEVCEFVPGYYDRTLDGFDLRPAVVFEDVDLISSAEAVLKACYPRMPRGAVFFSHEACFSNFVEHFFVDHRFWQATFNEPPPYLLGGFTGLCDGAPALSYFRRT